MAGAAGRPNIYDSRFEYDEASPAAYLAGVAEIGRQAGGRELSVRLFEVAPHSALCPYHYEYVEEWLIVLSGQIDLRCPTGTETLTPGDVVCFEAGARGAHRTANTGDETARLLMFSSAATPAISVYPDSGKVGVWTADESDEFMFFRAEGNREYYDGEPSI